MPHFVHPSFVLVALVVGAVVALLYVRLAVVRRRAVAALASRHLLEGLTASVSRGRRALKAALVVAGVSLVTLALARPQLGFTWRETHRRGADLLFAVDTSKSMLTRDIAPDRLERAKLAVKELAEKFPADRVGLVAFAGKAFLETPLTLDHAIFEESVDALDTNVIPLGGTDVASAIRLGTKTLGGDEHAKVFVLLTDGEDLAGDALEAADQAAQAGVAVHTIGVGTPKGELVPVMSKKGETSFVKDESGKLVTSRLDEPLLRRIATRTHGTYHALGDSGEGATALYQDALRSLPESDLASRSEKVPVERFQWPLGIGLFFLALEPLIGERRRVRARLAAPRLARRGVAQAAAATLVALTASTALASPQSGEREYRRGLFSKAEADYAAAAKSWPADTRLDFNAGSAAYKAGDWDVASKAFEKALRSEDLGLAEKAYYNLGDTRYRTGEASLKAGKKDDTIKAWRDAISDYDGSLHLQPTDADAKFNKQFVEKKLAELEKENPPKPDEQKKQDQNQENKKSDGKQAQNDDKQPGKGAKSTPQEGNGKGKEGQKTGGQQAGNDGKQGKQGNEEGKDEPPKRLGDIRPTGGASQGTGETDEAPSAAGELSKSEARALLDSLKGELEVAARAGTPAKPAHEAEPRKDW